MLLEWETTWGLKFLKHQSKGFELNNEGSCQFTVLCYYEYELALGC